MKTEFKGIKGRKEAEKFLKENLWTITSCYQLTDGTKIINYKIGKDLWHELIPKDNKDLYFLIKVS